MKLKHFILSYILLLVIFSSCTFSLFNTNREVDILGEKLSEIARPYIESGQVAGMAVGLAKGKEILLLKGYGKANLEFDVPMPADASFEIGSVTKQFTAVAIMQLVEQGKLSLEDDFTKYIPFNTQGNTISIARLLDHTSGIMGYTEARAFGEIARLALPRDTLLRLMEVEPFDFATGEAEIYNNTAFYILGLIIEKLSGQSYEEYIRENIFDKTDMSRSYYTDLERVIPKRTSGYEFYNDTLYRAGFLDPTWPYAAGSLSSTVEDLLNWNYKLHNGEVLKEELYQELIKPGQLNDGTQLRYAKGLAVGKYKGQDIIQHGGGIPGYLTASKYLPEEQLSIVVIFNTAGPAAPDQVANDLIDFYLNLEEPTFSKFEGKLTDFVGEYEGRGRGQTISLKVSTADGQLVLENMTNGQVDTLNYISNDKWGLGTSEYDFRRKGNAITCLDMDFMYGHYVLPKK